jgi:hypothetical protein
MDGSRNGNLPMKNIPRTPFARRDLDEQVVRALSPILILLRGRWPVA